MALIASLTAPYVALGADAGQTEAVRRPRAERRIHHPEGTPRKMRGTHPPERGAMPPVRERVTPYGGFCPQCSTYGFCDKMLDDKESAIALKKYFSDRGLAISNVAGKGRFMKAEVYRDDKLVDKVVFDKKTGRIRSMY